MKWYHGKTVLVTGASSGIGAAIARELGGSASHLILTARTESALEVVARDVRALGTEATVITLDLAQPGAAQDLAGRIERLGLQVDVLLNNAGFAATGPLAEIDPSTLDELVTLNIGSLVALTRHFLEPMIARGAGGILNVASLAGYQPVPRMAAYGASKTFVREFSQAIHFETRNTGVHVSCLCPGATDSNFFARAKMARPAGNHPKSDPHAVARDGLRALAKNRRVQVSGLLTHVLTVGARISPTWVNMAVGNRWMQQAK